MSMKYFVFIIAQKKIIAAYMVKISVHNGTNQVTYIADIQLNQKNKSEVRNFIIILYSSKRNCP